MLEVILGRRLSSSNAVNAENYGSGTATGGNATTITETGRTWKTDYWLGQLVNIPGGGSGTVTANTQDKITVGTLENLNVAAKSVYKVGPTYAFDFGDYSGLAFANGNFYPSWSDNSNSTKDNSDGANRSLDLYTAKISVAVKTASLNNLNSSNLVSMVGQPITFTATVTLAGGTPTGNVAFLDGNNPLGSASLDANGKATFVTSTLGAGSHTLTAVYGGDANFDGSTS